MSEFLRIGAESNRRCFIAALLGMTARKIVYFCLHRVAFSAFWAFCAFLESITYVFSSTPCVVP